MPIIEINTAQEFMSLLDREEKGIANDILSVDVMSDLDFEGVEYVPFTSAQNPNSDVYMTLDFHGHCIKNINYAPDESKSTINESIFPYRMKGIIKDCVIRDCIFILLHNHRLCVVSMSSPNISEFPLHIENLTIEETVSIISSSNSELALFNGAITVKNVTVKGTYNSGGNFIVFNTSGTSNLVNCAIIASISCVSMTGLIVIGQGIFTEIINCFARCRIRITNTRSAIYNNFLSTNFGRTFFGPRIAFCYAANAVTFEKEPTTVYGFTNASATYTENVVYKCYFDNTLLTGAADDDRFGQPTKNLKSAAWLREQGWLV